jgi:hypothetical protein
MKANKVFLEDEEGKTWVAGEDAPITLVYNKTALDKVREIFKKQPKPGTTRPKNPKAKAREGMFLDGIFALLRTPPSPGDSITLTPDELNQLHKDTYQFFEKLYKTPPPPEIVKASLHAELQKFGKKKKVNQLDLFDAVSSADKELATTHNIEVAGIDISKAQNKALFAIQTLLSKTSFEGNVNGKEIRKFESGFKFSGYLPQVRVSISEYLDAFGVGKRTTARDKQEYNSNERAEALKALRDLHDNRYLFFYEKKYWVDAGKGKPPEERFDVVKTVRPLITITEGYQELTRPEKDSLMDGATTGTILGSGVIPVDQKLTHIQIEPAPILIDQVDKYFVLKPANCYQEIKLLVGNASKFTERFIDYLFVEVAKRESSARQAKGGKNTHWKIEINYKELARTLRMDSWLNSRNWKQIRGALDKAYDIAKQLGYLNGYKTIQGVTKEKEVFTLNPEKFKRAKEIDSEREQIEAQAITNS